MTPLERVRRTSVTSNALAHTSGTVTDTYTYTHRERKTNQHIIYASLNLFLGFPAVLVATKRKQKAWEAKSHDKASHKQPALKIYYAQQVNCFRAYSGYPSWSMGIYMEGLALGVTLVHGFCFSSVFYGP